MDLSIVIVTWNTRELTLSCLDSLEGAVRRPHEIVVVDNGSTDGTAEAVAGRSGRVTVLRNDRNLGFAAAVNRGIRESAGRVIVLLNSDARPEAGALEALAAHLEANPGDGMAGPLLLHEDGRPQNSHASDPTLAGELLNRSVARLLRGGRAAPAPDGSVVEVETLIGASMAVRRDVVDRIGGLDEDYFVFLEETDWCLRARRAGYRVVLVPSARVTHLQGRTRAKVRLRAKVEYVRSLFTYFRKHGGFVALRLLYVPKVAVEFAAAAVGAAVTFGLWPRGRRRLIETGYLLLWLLLLCPRSFGLAPAERTGA